MGPQKRLFGIVFILGVPEITCLHSRTSHIVRTDGGIQRQEVAAIDGEMTDFMQKLEIIYKKKQYGTYVTVCTYTVTDVVFHRWLLISNENS